MALPASLSRATLADYERLEAESELRHEFYDGEIFVMPEWDPAETVAAGGRRAHSTLCSNVVRRLGNALDGTPCRVFTSDCRVVAPAEDEGESDLFTFPDASVVCGDAAWGPPADTLLNPTLLVEVLSPSTEAYDRGAKFRLYRRIPSLRTVVFVASERVGAETFEREDDGAWRLVEPAGDAVGLRALDVSLSLEALYAGVEFDPDAPREHPG